jgi:hypothetical protein
MKVQTHDQPYIMALMHGSKTVTSAAKTGTAQKRNSNWVLIELL